MVATGQLGRGGVVLVWTLEQCPGGGNSSLAVLTGVSSCLGLVCPGTETGRAAAQSATSSRLGSGPPDLGHINLKVTRFYTPLLPGSMLIFVFVFLSHDPYCEAISSPMYTATLSAEDEIYALLFLGSDLRLSPDLTAQDIGFPIPV